MQNMTEEFKSSGTSSSKKVGVHPVNDNLSYSHITRTNAQSNFHNVMNKITASNSINMRSLHASSSRRLQDGERFACDWTSLWGSERT